MVALLQRERPQLLADEQVTEAGGCLRVVVEGVKDGEPHRYVCSLSSKGAGAGEGTGIPAAIGAALHLAGTLGDHPGVHAPEAIMPVDAVLELAGIIVSKMSIGDGEGIPLTIEHVAPDGTVTIMPMAL
jgi:saccharopine dehydrogenase (NAD+, L-lysine-forming)